MSGVPNFVTLASPDEYKKYYVGKIVIHNSADISVDDDIKIAKENNYKSFNC